jgi:hypothetical protein
MVMCHFAHNVDVNSNMDHFDLQIGQLLLVWDVVREQKCLNLDVTGRLLAFVLIMGG